ncbi:MAG: pyridoxamine 5'-phosphate oxidase family protein [Labilithrix sp.]|nr:pyridoxamine 5'-phosphate oxidase family protein [Labilithrix sp.]
MPQEPIDSSELVERAIAYVRKHHCMSLATAGPEGLWAAPVFYVHRGLALCFVSRNDSRHVRNIEADHHVAATIHDDVAHWHEIRGVQLEGVAERVEGARSAEVLSAFRERYPFADRLWWTSSEPAPRGAQHIYLIRPSRVLFIDHGVCAERGEIPHDYLEREMRAA